MNKPSTPYMPKSPIARNLFVFCFHEWFNPFCRPRTVNWKEWKPKLSTFSARKLRPVNKGSFSCKISESPWLRPAIIIRSFLVYICKRWFVQERRKNHPLSTLNAITKHPMATYGLSLSPIRANFQKTPSAPVLFLSSNAGQVACTYVQVQMAKRMTRSNDWKLKSAD